MAHGKSVFMYLRGIVFLLLWSGLFPLPAGADDTEDDDFLRWQAEQAEQIDSLDNTSDETTDSPEENVNAGSRQAFESLLKDSFFGSYSFYKKLSDSDKVDVFQRYHKTGSITETRRLIMKRFMRH